MAGDDDGGRSSKQVHENIIKKQGTRFTDQDTRCKFGMVFLCLDSLEPCALLQLSLRKLKKDVTGCIYTE